MLGLFGDSGKIEASSMGYIGFRRFVSCGHGKSLLDLELSRRLGHYMLPAGTCTGLNFGVSSGVVETPYRDLTAGKTIRLYDDLLGVSRE